jgi:hypothetical protein
VIAQWAVAKRDFAADTCVRSDFHVVAELRMPIDDGGRMNFQSTPVSLKLK